MVYAYASVLVHTAVFSLTVLNVSVLVRTPISSLTGHKHQV